MTTPPPQDLWFRRYHPAPDARTTLFCFPHAGGSATYYTPMSAMLAPEFAVAAVQYPGRQDRRSEALVPTLDELADRVADVIGPWLTGPAAFFGHSMGAIVAFEVARRLQARGGPQPSVLFASGCRAPSRVRDDGVHRRGDAGVVEELRSMGGTDARVLAEPELLEMVLPAMRNDYRAIETYRQEAGVRIGAPVVVLGATDDARTSVDEARAWHGHTTAAPGAEHFFEGGHFYLEGHARDVVRIVAEELRASERAGSAA